MNPQAQVSIPSILIKFHSSGSKLVTIYSSLMLSTTSLLSMRYLTGCFQKPSLVQATRHRCGQQRYVWPSGNISITSKVSKVQISGEKCASRSQVPTSRRGNGYKRPNLTGELTEKKLALISNRAPRKRHLRLHRDRVHSYQKRRLLAHSLIDSNLPPVWCA